MHDPEVFRQLLVFLLAPVVVVPIFRWMRSSQILGYLAAGVLTGPHALGLIESTELTKALAELGIAFLFFAIGLELSLDRLRVMRRLVFGLGTLQVAVTTAAIGSLAYALGPGPAAAFVIGGGLALSSTAFVLQLMVERGEQVTRFGRTAFAVLLFQDLAVVPLLAIVSVLGQAETSPWLGLAWAGLKAVVALVLIVAVGRLVLRPVFRLVAATRSPELFVSATLLVVLGTGWLTVQGGLSLPLGAFLAGLLLSETEYRHQVEADIRPFRGLLVGLFFLTVGLSIDLALVARSWPLILGLLSALLVGKSALLLALCLLFRESLDVAVRVALLLAQGGEFAFILFGAAMEHELLNVQTGQILVATVALSMVATPFLATLGHTLAGRLQQGGPTDLAALQEESQAYADHVLIAGFGRVGQTVAKVLGAAGVPYVALDLDHARVTRCRARGLPAFYGDASRVDVLSAAGAGRARAAVLTMDHPADIDRAVAALHQHFAELRIFVRGRDPHHGRRLAQFGATAVVPEAVEASLQLGGIVLTSVGASAEDAAQVIAQFRRGDYAGLETIAGEQS
jgi:monovalent cation:H+ antiporter-2, CPA2 family